MHASLALPETGGTEWFRIRTVVGHQRSDWSEPVRVDAPLKADEPPAVGTSDGDESTPPDNPGTSPAPVEEIVAPLESPAAPAPPAPEPTKPDPAPEKPADKSGDKPAEKEPPAATDDPATP
jgi:hypothetical protein